MSCHHHHVEKSETMCYHHRVFRSFITLILAMTNNFGPHGTSACRLQVCAESFQKGGSISEVLDANIF